MWIWLMQKWKCKNKTALSSLLHKVFWGLKLKIIMTENVWPWLYFLWNLLGLISKCLKYPWYRKGFFIHMQINFIHLNYLYNRGHCLQTPPRQRNTDPKPVCHFDPLLMEIDVSYRAFGLVLNRREGRHKEIRSWDILHW